jgi:hypothetical protein
VWLRFLLGEKTKSGSDGERVGSGVWLRFLLGEKKPKAAAKGYGWGPACGYGSCWGARM